MLCSPAIQSCCLVSYSKCSSFHMGSESANTDDRSDRDVLERAASPREWHPLPNGRLGMLIPCKKRKVYLATDTWPLATVPVDGLAASAALPPPSPSGVAGGFWLPPPPQAGSEKNGAAQTCHVFRSGSRHADLTKRSSRPPAPPRRVGPAPARRAGTYRLGGAVFTK